MLSSVYNKISNAIINSKAIEKANKKRGVYESN